MPLNVVSLLLVLFQFFHFGSMETVHVKQSDASVSSARHSYIAYSRDLFPCIEGLEESEDKWNESAAPVAAALFVQKLPSMAVGSIPLLNRVFKIHRARSDLNGRHLFREHCNFRV